MDVTGRGDEERQARFDAVLAEYMELLDRGGVDRQRFLAEHADLEEELRKYFESSDEVEQLVGRLRTPGPADGPPGSGG
jgi:hypothetical protein